MPVTPTFLVLGAAKAGTDAIYSQLGQHPEVYVSPVKETNYFVFCGERLHFSGPGDERALDECRIVSQTEYLSLFAAAAGAKAIGEASPWYLYRPEVPDRIRGMLPEARLIAVLRHPLDRAFSAFAMLHRDAREPETEFARALQAEPRRIAAGWEPIWHYRAMGRYAEQLERFLAIFPREQLRIYLYDDFLATPLTVIQDIFAFIGVDPAFVPDTSARPNVSYVPKHHRLHRLLLRDGRAARLARIALPAGPRQKLKWAIVRRNLRRPELPNSLRRELIGSFAEEISRLERLLDRDLTAWRTA